jgi:hypothetical protein
MNAPSNKPRDIKDLKARLGRTVQAGQPGASVPPAGPGGPLGGPRVGASVPPPAVRSPFAPPGSPVGGSLPAPAFAQPGARPAPGMSNRPGMAQPQPSAAPAGAPAQGRSPFAMGGAAPVQQVVEKKVRLVIDDSAIKDDEIGRKTSMTTLIVAGIAAVLALGLGLGVGLTRAENNLWNLALHDAKDIYTKINATSKDVDAARQAVQAIVAASQGGAGRKATVDYKAIESLVALKRPFSASEFSNRRYLAFPPEVVNDLFEYYNGINLLFDRFATLGAKTAGPRAREALDKSALAADELIASEYGLVISKAGEEIVGGVVVVRRKPADEAAADAKDKKDKDKEEEGTIMLVSSREGGQEVERKLYTGQTDFAEKFADYVIGVDKARSMKTLGSSAKLFGEFRGDLTEINGLMLKIAETQGRLIKRLGEVAALEERGIF